MRVLAVVLGLAVAAIGVVGLVAPSLLFDFGRSLQSAAALYAVSGVRVLFGLVLFLAAAGSRMPKTLRVIGIVMVVAGLIGPFFGVERIHAIVDWLSSRELWFIRLWMLVAIVFGLFVAYAVTPRSRDAR